jgi:hypothetical protein
VIPDHRRAIVQSHRLTVIVLNPSIWRWGPPSPTQCHTDLTQFHCTPRFTLRSTRPPPPPLTFINIFRFEGELMKTRFASEKDTTANFITPCFVFTHRGLKFNRSIDRPGFNNEKLKVFLSPLKNYEFRIYHRFINLQLCFKSCYKFYKISESFIGTCIG